MQISKYHARKEVLLLLLLVEGMFLCGCVCVVAAAVVVVGRINISATWPLKPLPMTANIMKRYGSREGERNEKDKKRTVK